MYTEHGGAIVRNVACAARTNCGLMVVDRKTALGDFGLHKERALGDDGGPFGNSGDDHLIADAAQHFNLLGFKAPGRGLDKNLPVAIRAAQYRRQRHGNATRLALAFDVVSTN